MSMNTPLTGMAHPADEQLAAFVDGHLDESSRHAIRDHVSDCDECYAVIQTIAEFAESEAVSPGRFGRRVVLAAVTLTMAAAATLAVFFIAPDVAVRRDMQRLLVAAEHLDHRSLEGRVDEQLTYKALKDVARGPIDRTNPRVALGKEAADLIDAAIRRPTTSNLRRAGVALLLINAQDEAIVYLERANHRANSKDAKILALLAVAYQARARETHSQSDARAAVLVAEKAWTIQKSPLTAWNRAVALKQAQSPKAAAAWRDYIEIDSTSGWTEEARRQGHESPR